MKTSVDIPDWLHAEVLAANPGMRFSTLVRDALVLALPEWRRQPSTTAGERALKAQFRLLAATRANSERQAAVHAHKRRPATPPAKRARRAPATRPKARTSKAGASQPTT